MWPDFQAALVQMPEFSDTLVEIISFKLREKQLPVICSYESIGNKVRSECSGVECVRSVLS